MKDKAMELWKKHQGEAEWDRYDLVDPPYTWECNVALEIEGFKFEGWGYNCCGDRTVVELDCTCPDGSIIKIF